jgi:PAS domain S-box-containing protein
MALNEAVQNGSEVFQAMFECAGIGILVADAAGYVTRTNPTFNRFMGYSEKEIFGKHLSDFVHPDEGSAIRKSVAQLLNGRAEPYQAEHRAVSKSQKILYLRITVSLIRDAAGQPRSVVALIEDLTKHRETEAELRKLSRVVEQSPASIIITDNAGRIEYVNPKFIDVTGYSTEELLGKTPRILKSGEMPPQGYKKLWETITSGKQWHGEFHNRKKNGQLFWESASISPLLDRDGTITHFIAIKEDITKRKEAELRLTEEIGFNWSIISGAPVGILVFEASGRCVVANKAAAQTIDTTVSELLKQDFLELESWRVSGLLQMAEETLADSNARQGEFHFKTTLGKEVWVVCHFSSILQWNRPHLLMMMNDITGPKLAKDKIYEQAALLDKAQDAILVLDESRRIKFWNTGAERIYGWTADEAKGQNLNDLLHKGVVGPDFWHAIERVEQCGEWNGELTEYTKAGNSVVVEMRANLIRDSHGGMSVLIINTDVTKKREMERQLLRTQRIESLGTLAGGIAHDLNNVLAPVLLSIELLKNKVTDQEGRKLLQALEANMHRGAKLVKQVLTFGRGTQGHRVPLQISRVIGEIKEMIKETFPKSVTFDYSAREDLWPVIGDGTQIYQVLMNICINARDAMASGGRLCIKAENFRLTESYASLNLEALPGPYLAIHISDNGTGIPKNIQDRMFEPFFTTKLPGEGTGLGLSTVLGIVKSHGGFIKCYSEPQKGTTFQVYFPAETSSAPAEIGADMKGCPLPRGQNELLLVVDDEEAVREVARKILELFGYRVIAAVHGAEALSIYSKRHNEIAVVITDMAMPVMDGPALITALKKINPAVRIICSSGLSPEGRESGATHFISKPYTAESILHPLDELLKEDRGRIK